MRHAVLICWSQADQAFIAEVPELPGCMADGPTQATALRAVQTVAKEWVATAEATGRPSPVPTGRPAHA